MNRLSSRRMRMLLSSDSLSGFNVTTLAAPFASMWAGDPDSPSQTDGAAVTTLHAHGTSGGTLAALGGFGTGTYRAHTTTFNSQPTIEFVGTDCLGVNVADQAQTWSAVIVGSMGTTGGQRLIGSGTAATHGFGRTAGGANVLTTGTTLSGGTPDTDPHRWLVVAAGASSVVLIDDAALLSGNAGTGALTWLVVGAAWDGVSTALNGLVGHLGFVGWYAGDVRTHPQYTLLCETLDSMYGL